MDIIIQNGVPLITLYRVRWEVRRKDDDPLNEESCTLGGYGKYFVDKSQVEEAARWATAVYPDMRHWVEAIQVTTLEGMEHEIAYYWDHVRAELRAALGAAPRGGSTGPAAPRGGRD